MADFRNTIRQVNYAYAHKMNSYGDLAPDNNLGYGLWETKEKAWAGILAIFGAKDEATDSDDETSGRNIIPIGIKVGVCEFDSETGMPKTDATVKEYWLNGGHKYKNLVEKGGGKTYQAGEYAILISSDDSPKINVNFGDVQDGIISDLFDFDDTLSGNTTSGNTKYSYNNDGTQANHASLVWNSSTKKLYAYLSVAQSISGNSWATYVVTYADGTTGTGSLTVQSDGHASTEKLNYAMTSFASATQEITKIVVTPVTDSTWAWVVNGDSQSIVELAVS